jgi:nucleoid-associated protein YgaU
MELAKLTIKPESGGAVEALFNPTEISLDKSVTWQTQEAAERDVPELQFKNGQPRTLNLDLFFDTFDTPAAVKQDVRDYTELVFKLALVSENLHRPPVCKLSWGKMKAFFQGVLERLSQRFTLFAEDGTPVRATLRCTFKEWRSNPDDQRQQGKKSSDVAKQRTVRRGDTLSAIAAEAYRDPAQWRPIAEENGIDDPRSLEPGTALLIPSLTGDRRD